MIYDSTDNFIFSIFLQPSIRLTETSQSNLAHVKLALLKQLVETKGQGAGCIAHIPILMFVR